MTAATGADLSLYHLLEPEVWANPYPLYQRLRSEEPVHWDSYLHAWVVTRYSDVRTVLLNFQAARMPLPEQMSAMGLGHLSPVAHLLVRQMIFMDPPRHTRIRALAATAFTPSRVAAIAEHIQEITDGLVDAVIDKGRMDVIAHLADPLPTTVTAELMGVPLSDSKQLKRWSLEFSEVLGNFQHNPEHASRMLQVVQEMSDYYKEQLREQRSHPREGVVHALLTAEVEGDRLTEDEVIANCIITMTGGQETTTSLIGNGLLALLGNPHELERLQADPSLVPGAVEELLRFESPIQKTARIAPADVDLGGRRIRQRDAVLAVIGAANRDPERFRDPDRLDLSRADNYHLAFAYGAHYCFGAPLARLEAQIMFRTLFRRVRNLALEPGPIRWRHNTTFRGLEALPVTFDAGR